MVKVNGVNGQPLDRVKHNSLLNEGSQEEIYLGMRLRSQIFLGI